MWRTAIYARETTGGGRRALERQVATLVAQVARQAGWHHVATYVDQAPGGAGPGFARLLADAPGHFDLVVVDGYGRLSANRHELAAVTGSGSRARFPPAGATSYGSTSPKAPPPA